MGPGPVPSVIPSSCLRPSCGVAVDFDGDGRRDLVDSVPDALASTANYLVRADCSAAASRGCEVKLPQGFDESLAGVKKRRPLASNGLRWGVLRIGDEPGPRTMALPRCCCRPVGGRPAFLVFRNFDAIYSYNAAESYALAIAHRPTGSRGGDFATPWPTDDLVSPAPSDANCRPCCSSVGHDIGEVDGMIEVAPGSHQGRTGAAGLRGNGRAGRKILDALRTPASLPDAAPR